MIHEVAKETSKKEKNNHRDDTESLGKLRVDGLVGLLYFF